MNNKLCVLLPRKKFKFTLKKSIFFLPESFNQIFVHVVCFYADFYQNFKHLFLPRDFGCPYYQKDILQSFIPFNEGNKASVAHPVGISGISFRPTNSFVVTEGYYNAKAGSLFSFSLLFHQM